MTCYDMYTLYQTFQCKLLMSEEMQMNSTYNYFEFKSIDTFNYAAGMNLFCLINGMPRETIKSLYREQNIYHE